MHEPPETGKESDMATINFVTKLCDGSRELDRKKSIIQEVFAILGGILNKTWNEDKMKFLGDDASILEVFEVERISGGHFQVVIVWRNGKSVTLNSGKDVPTEHVPRLYSVLEEIIAFFRDYEVTCTMTQFFMDQAPEEV